MADQNQSGGLCWRIAKCWVNSRPRRSKWNGETPAQSDPQMRGRCRLRVRRDRRRGKARGSGGTYVGIIMWDIVLPGSDADRWFSWPPTGSCPGSVVGAAGGRTSRSPA